MQQTKIIVLAVFLIFALVGQAFGELKNSDAIKYRQAAYSFISWNMGKLKAQVIDGSVPYNQAQVEASANVIAAIANSGLGALFPAGSDSGVGFHKTRLKSEFFENPAEVAEVAKTFNAKANALADVAKSGDRDAIKAAFGELGRSCKGCHDKFRAKRK